ncbi:hypothetical protein [Streptomyces clavifer]
MNPRNSRPCSGKELPAPVRKPAWGRIKVKAFGINGTEVTTRRG